MRKIENLFEVLDCPEGFKVRLATHQFEKEQNSGKVLLNPELVSQP